MDDMEATDEILVSNVAGDELYAVIKAASHQLLKSKFMAAKDRRAFLARIKLHLSIVTSVVTLAVTYTPKGETLPVIKNFRSNSIEKTWEPLVELEEATEVSMTIIDDNEAHPVATVELTYVEAYNA